MNPTSGPPSRILSVSLFSITGLLLGLLLARVLATGSSFDDFPGRTIGVSLLSDIDPHFRISIFLLASALAIVFVTACFVFSGLRPERSAASRVAPTTAVLATCLGVNLVAGVLHDDRPLFFHAAALCAGLLGSWLWHLRTKPSGTPGSWALRLALAWQGTTLIIWLAALPAKSAVFYPVLMVLYLVAGRAVGFLLAGPGAGRRWSVAVGIWLALAPVLLVAAVELAYFIRHDDVRTVDTLLVFGGLSLACLAISRARHISAEGLVGTALLGVLLSNFVINQYDNAILYRGYDLFHLAERMLPLQQWDAFRSLPFWDYHPGHGLFDLFPHGFYHLLQRGDPLEAALWGNGYFLGWVAQTVYIGLFFACLSPVMGHVSAFLLLFLLPVFPILEPYNTLLLLPILHLQRLPRAGRLLTWWVVQWSLVLALLLWRPDFGLVAAAGNLVVMAALSWYRRDTVHLATGVGGLAIPCLVALVVAVLTSIGDRLSWILSRCIDFMDIQLLAASYDSFYKEWDYLAVVQYVVMPLVGALAGGYSLARIYLREDQRELAIHLVVIFATAVGFALSIRLLQRHSLLEGFTKTNFFYFTALFAFFSLRIPTSWRGVGAVVLIMLAFLATPKTRNYSDQSMWSPRRSYPPVTHEFSMPVLARQEPRLVNKVTKYNAFERFASYYLTAGDAFYDFSNAPMLYMLAGVKLPVYFNETVWHTSEKVQVDTLAELRDLHATENLPFVVFRRNKPRWDALDGVDNALRSYRMAEYIYRHYTPCVRISDMDIWTDRRVECRESLAQRLPADFPASLKLKYLESDYLDQFIEFGHLAYIWANFDSVQENAVRKQELAPRPRAGGDIELGEPDIIVRRNLPCYLDLQIDSAVLQDALVSLEDRALLSFTVRPGKHNYRVRLSTLWYWHQAIDTDSLRLQLPEGASVHRARLLEVEET